MLTVADFVPQFSHKATTITVGGTTVSLMQVWVKRAGGQRFYVDNLDPAGGMRVFLRAVGSQQGVVVDPAAKLLTDYTLGS